MTRRLKKNCFNIEALDSFIAFMNKIPDNIKDVVADIPAFFRGNGAVFERKLNGGYSVNRLTDIVNRFFKISMSPETFVKDYKENYLAVKHEIADLPQSPDHFPLTSLIIAGDRARKTPPPLTVEGADRSVAGPDIRGNAAGTIIGSDPETIPDVPPGTSQGVSYGGSTDPSSSVPGSSGSDGIGVDLSGSDGSGGRDAGFAGSEGSPVDGPPVGRFDTAHGPSEPSADGGMGSGPDNPVAGPEGVPAPGPGPSLGGSADGSGSDGVHTPNRPAEAGEGQKRAFGGRTGATAEGDGPETTPATPGRISRSGLAYFSPESIPGGPDGSGKVPDTLAAADQRSEMHMAIKEVVESKSASFVNPRPPAGPPFGPSPALAAPFLAGTAPTAPIVPLPAADGPDAASNAHSATADAATYGEPTPSPDSSGRGAFASSRAALGAPRTTSSPNRTYRIHKTARWVKAG